MIDQHNLNKKRVGGLCPEMNGIWTTPGLEVRRWYRFSGSFQCQCFASDTFFVMRNHIEDEDRFFFSTANAGVNSWNFSWATCNNVNAKDSSGYDSMSPSFPSMEREWWQWKNVKRWVYILQHYSVTIFWSYETNPFNETSDRTKTPRGLLH